MDLVEDYNYTDDSYALYEPPYEFDKELIPPRSGFCKSFDENLKLGDLWWIVIIIQISAFLVLGLLYKLVIVNVRRLHCIAFTNIITLYANVSLWFWSVYLIIALAACGIGVRNPLFVVGIVFVSIFGVISLLDCVFGSEGWGLVDLKQMKDAVQYLDKLRTCPPVHRVHVESYHMETNSTLHTRGKLFTRTRKTVTFTDHRDFPYDSWSDVSDWPLLESLASSGFLIIGISINKYIEPGDQATKQRFETFRQKFVQQNCHRDEQIRSWVTSEIPDSGTEQSIFVATKSRQEMPIVMKVGLFICLATLCLSCPLRVFIRNKSKMWQLQVRKVYFSDVNKPIPSPVPSHTMNGPTPNVVINRNYEGNTNLFSSKMDTMRNGPNLNMPHLQSETAAHQSQNNMTQSDYNRTSYGNGSTPHDPYYGPQNQVNNEPWSRRQPYNSTDKSNLSRDLNGHFTENSFYDGGGGGYSYSNKNMDIYDNGAPVKKNYLPGKDYYDPSLYTQKQRNEEYYERNQNTHNYQNNTTPLNDRHYSDDGYYQPSTHPRNRNSALKNTNIESDILAREGTYRNRRVHYEDSPREQRYFNQDTYYTDNQSGYRSPTGPRRYQSPSPRPRQHRQLPNLGYHRSRRTLSDSSVADPKPLNRGYSNMEQDKRYNQYAETDKRYGGAGMDRVPPQPRRSVNTAVSTRKTTDMITNYPPSEITEDVTIIMDEESQYNA